MQTQIKICGVTNVADALAAAEAGADLIGLNFYEKSPRFLTQATAEEIARALPPFVQRVGVFVNPAEDMVRRAITGCNLNLLQFHGDEPTDFCTRFGLMSLKAIRVRDESSLEVLADFQTDAFLLDAYSPASHGGTGEKFNWALAVKAKKYGKPIFLAGGLTPENVAEAVKQVRPFAVAVSSGVESTPGKKDTAKIRAFIQSVRDAK